MSTDIRSSLHFTKQQQPCSSAQLAAKPRSLLHTFPVNSKVSLQIKEKILCLELMGVDSGKALSQNPSLQSAPLSSIHAILTFLQSKGISQNDLPRIVGMCPQTLTSDIKDDLDPVFDFLAEDLKVPQSHFRKVINKCPRLLISSVKDQLKPCLFYLQRLGFKNVEALAYHDSVLLVSNVENTLIPKLNFLQSMGLSRSDAVGMALRCPALFTFSVENNFKPKYEYFLQMGRKVDELKEFPQYFAFSLEKRIKPRHAEALQNGIDMPLSTMLKATDHDFRQHLLSHPSNC